MTQMNAIQATGFFQDVQETMCTGLGWCSRQISTAYHVTVDTIVSVYNAVLPFFAAAATFVKDNSLRVFEYMKDNKEAVAIGSVVVGILAVIGYLASAGSKTSATA